MMDSSASLETLFDIKSQHMGIVSVSSNPSNNLIATNTVDGYICIRDSETGMDLLFLQWIGALVMSMTLGPMEAWPIQLSKDVLSLLSIEGRARSSTREVETAP